TPLFFEVYPWTSGQTPSSKADTTPTIPTTIPLRAEDGSGSVSSCSSPFSSIGCTLSAAPSSSPCNDNRRKLCGPIIFRKVNHETRQDNGKGRVCLLGRAPASPQRTQEAFGDAINISG